MNWTGFERKDLTAILNFARMFLRDRFLGSRLGSIWVVVNPLVLMALYTFVFGFVFKARLNGSNTTLAYSAWLVAGYGPWLAISEGLNSAAASIYGNASIIKNVAIKAECLPLAAVLVGLIPLLVSLGFLLVLLMVDGNRPTWHALLALPAIAVMFAFVAALGVGLAPLVVFYRDIGVALPTLLTLILFGSPIFYPVEAIPEALRWLARWNPFYILTEWIREPLVLHRIPDALGLGWVVLLSALIGAFNLAAFRRVKGYFPGAL